MLTIGQLGNLSRHRSTQTRLLPKASVGIMHDWLNEHLHHPYPNKEEMMALVSETGLSETQVANWFNNTRRRHRNLFNVPVTAVPFLLRYFRDNIERPFPDEAAVQRLAEDANLTNEQVELWMADMRTLNRTHMREGSQWAMTAPRSSSALQTDKPPSVSVDAAPVTRSTELPMKSAVRPMGPTTIAYRSAPPGPLPVPLQAAEHTGVATTLDPQLQTQMQIQYQYQQLQQLQQLEQLQQLQQLQQLEQQRLQQQRLLPDNYYAAPPPQHMAPPTQSLTTCPPLSAESRLPSARSLLAPWPNPTASNWASQGVPVAPANALAPFPPPYTSHMHPHSLHPPVPAPPPPPQVLPQAPNLWSSPPGFPQQLPQLTADMSLSVPYRSAPVDRTPQLSAYQTPVPQFASSTHSLQGDVKWDMRAKRPLDPTQNSLFPPATRVVSEEKRLRLPSVTDPSSNFTPDGPR